MKDGLFFLHEFPNGSSSVNEPCLASLLKEPGVYLVKGPMCAWGMTSKDERGEGLVKKETCWVTNSEFIAYELDVECTNASATAVWHRHVHLVNQRANAARIYPPKLVAAILRGAREQMRATGEMMNFNYPVPEDPVIARDLEPEVHEELEAYWDDANGGYLDPVLVRQARKEEIAEIHNYKVYEKRPIKECLEVTGKKPMAIRWVDTNKGDLENPEYRSRIVAKDLKARRDPSMPAIDTFAPMPALEMLKLMLSLAAMWKRSHRGKVLVIMIVDVRRAHWNAQMKTGKKVCAVLH